MLINIYILYRAGNPSFCLLHTFRRIYNVIYPTQFMEEAGEAFLPHLYPLLESYSSVKINFELFGEFAL